MSQVIVDNLTKTFGETVALDDVSFEVPEGEFVIILGVSGSGKSTLLRTMSGLLSPNEGEVRIEGQTVVEPRPDIAMIFQQHNIVGDMSAYSNALSGGVHRTGVLESILQLQDEEEKHLALEALETVALLDEAQKKGRRMSGGQQQRVGIARALVQQPDILLADEPVASLDPGSAQDVMGHLRDASEERGLTTFSSLHQVNIARKFGHRFIGLRDGEKVFDGYRDELTIDAVDKIYGDIETEGMFVGAGNSDESSSAETVDGTTTKGKSPV